MFLRRIEIVGFKSFAEKTVLTLDNGLTAVVGPNGCGKSNVVEAIRWVLGEQKPSTLRSKTMGDVIFSGASASGPVSMAQVTLVLDNSSRALPIESDEVTISRRLYRDGESKYSINRRNCMLRDVKNVLYNSGLGAPEYAIMQREMIDVLLANKANERRMLIEEAAGVMKYRSDIKQALSRLKSSESAVTRLTDIADERGRHVRRLKGEALKAKRLKKYQDRMTHLRRLIASASLLSFRASSEPLYREKAKFGTDLGRLSSKLTSLLSKEEAGRLHIQEAELEISDRRADLSKSLEEAASLDTALQMIDDQAREGEKEKSLLLEEFASIRRRKEETSRLTERATMEMDLFAQELAELDKDRRSRQESALSATRTVEVLTENMSRAREQFAAAERMVNTARLELEKQELKRTYADRAIAQLIERVERASKAKRDAVAKISMQRKELETKEGESVLQRKKESKVQRRLDKARRLSQLVEGRQKNAAVTSGDLAAREEILSHLQSAREGYAEGAKFLMKANEQGVIALLGEELSPEPQCEKAVEAALSDAVDYVVVERRETARELLGLLRSNTAGKARIVEMARASSGNGVSPLPVSESDCRTLIGPIMDVVDVPERLQSLLHVLLDQTLLLKELPSDSEVENLWKKGWEQLVTVDGDVFRSDGIHQGGSGRDSGLLGRKRRLEEMQRRLEKSLNTERLLDARASRLKDVVAELFGQQRELFSESHELGLALERIKAELRVAEKELSESEQNLDSLERQRLAEEAGSKEAESALTKLVQDLSKKEAVLVSELSVVESIEDELREATALLNLGEEELKKLVETMRQLETRASSARSEVVRRTSEKEYVEIRVPELEKRISSIEQTIISAHEKILSLNQRKTLAKQKAGEFEAVLGKATTLRQERAKNLSEIAQSIQELRDRKGDVGDDEHRIELEITRLETRKEELLDRARVELGLEEADLLEMNPGGDVENLEKELETLLIKRTRLGDVNPHADDEHKEEAEALAALEEELDDVRQGRNELLSSIDRANRTARDRFLDTWERVNQNFSESFAALFPGGQARLELTGEGSVLSREVGIVVQPPEKRRRPVELLSGGERALTALAFLFALYKEKAGPICILDEVDAPLDDTNTTRFMEMLSSFSDEVQFLVITHNKHTMSKASRLLGITMENGVSRLFSVKLKDRNGDK